MIKIKILFMKILGALIFVLFGVLFTLAMTTCDETNTNVCSEHQVSKIISTSQDHTLSHESSNHPVKCPIHSEEIIQRIDSSFNSQKHVYCAQCIIDSEKSLGATLKTQDEFISNAAIFYLRTKYRLPSFEEPPSEYVKVVNKKEAVIEALKKHIEEEKRIVESAFDEISKVINERIEQAKNEHLNLLDEQLLNLFTHYNTLEKQLKKAFPSQDDVDFLFPSKEKIKQKFSKANDSFKINQLIREIKDDIAQENYGPDFNRADESDKTEYFEKLTKTISELEEIRPRYEIENLDLYSLKTTIQSDLNAFLQKALVLNNPINFTPEVTDIVHPEGFKLVRKWLPKEYGFKPVLLYKGSRDGLNPAAFHSRCDGKGATITFVKCKFDGASKVSVIGGFLDKNWHSENKDIMSEEAFVFSVGPQVKVPMRGQGRAAYGGTVQGPYFGQSGFIDITRDGHSGQFHRLGVTPPNAQATKIIDSDKYPGSGGVGGNIIDIEVYQVEKTKVVEP